MRDIPMFTTESGVASLVLREIPYRNCAYVRIHDAADAAALAEECVGFCRSAGAMQVFGTGHPYLETFPFHTAIIQMRRTLAGLPETDAALFPVSEATLSFWRELYNQKMANVANSAYMSVEDGRQMLRRGDGYFVHRGNTLLGIGIAAGETIGAVAATIPGAGETVVFALCHALCGEQAVLEVASTNEKAVALYERLGFIKTAELSRWHQLF